MFSLLRSGGLARKLTRAAMGQSVQIYKFAGVSTFPTSLATRTLVTSSFATALKSKLPSPSSALISSYVLSTSINVISTTQCITQSKRGFAVLALNRLKDVSKAKRVYKRVGRGRSSGLGKTCGRGQKGQGSRVGLFSKPRFEGGQTMLWRRSPKRGFVSGINRQTLETLSIGKVVRFVAAGRLDASKPITMKELLDSGCSGRFRYGIKLLQDVDETLVHRLPVPLHLEVSHCSASVKEAVEANGGTVKLVHYSRLGLRHLLRPGSLSFTPGPSVPKPKKAIRFEMQTVGKAGFLEGKDVMFGRIKRKVYKRN